MHSFQYPHLPAVCEFVELFGNQRRRRNLTNAAPPIAHPAATNPAHTNVHGSTPTPTEPSDESAVASVASTSARITHTGGNARRQIQNRSEHRPHR